MKNVVNRALAAKKKHLYFTIIAAILLTACEKTSIIPEIDPAYCPASIEVVLPERESNLLYPDPYSATMTLPLIVGEKVQLKYIISPDTVTFTDVLWSSSNATNVSVSEDGIIEALSASGLGYSIISVTPVGMYSSSGVSASLRVKVSAELAPATAIEVSSLDSVKSIFIGDTLQLFASILPEEATYRTVSWSSENEAVATVDKRGVVTGIGTNGKVSESTTIYATANDGSGVQGTFIVRVKDVVDPSEIKLDEAFDKDHYACWVGDKTVTLNYKLVPEESTASKIKWECSEPDIATVENGVIHLNQNGKFGEFTITATCPNGQSDQIRMNMPAGLIRENFLNEDNLTWSVAAQSGNGTETSQVWHPEGYLTCTTYNQSADVQRGDFKATGKVWLCSANYPLVALKMEYVNDKYAEIKSSSFKFDCVGKDIESGANYTGELGGGNNTWSKRYKCSDGSSVFIYDLREKSFPKAGGIMPLTSVVEFTTFQIKYADMKNSEKQIEYNVYWVETFKSLEEINAKLTNEGITWNE